MWLALLSRITWVNFSQQHVTIALQHAAKLEVFFIKACVTFQFSGQSWTFSILLVSICEVVCWLKMPSSVLFTFCPILTILLVAVYADKTLVIRLHLLSIPYLRIKFSTLEFPIYCTISIIFLFSMKIFLKINTRSIYSHVSIILYNILHAALQ